MSGRTRPATSPYGQYKSPYGTSCGTQGNAMCLDGAERYRDMCRHLHDLVESVAPGHLTWVMGANTGWAAGQYKMFYPGDAYVDWHAFDRYPGSENTSLDPYRSMAGHVLWKEALNLADKPIMILEFGVYKYGAGGAANDRAKWFSAFFNDARTNASMKNLGAFLYWQNGSSDSGIFNTRLRTSDPAARAWQAELSAHPGFWLSGAAGSAPKNDAKFLSQNVPSSMTAGKSYSVSVTMGNTGTAPWTRAAGHKLGSQNPRDNRTWGFARVELAAGESVGPGQSKTLSFQVTAPSTPGAYDFQWRMLRELVEWFGARTPNVRVSVQAPCEPPTGLQPAGTLNSSQATLSWSGVAGAVSYNVRLDDGTRDRYDDPRFATCGNSPHYYCENGIRGSSISGVPVKPGRSYTFWVDPVYNPPRGYCNGSVRFPVAAPSVDVTGTWSGTSVTGAGAVYKHASVLRQSGSVVNGISGTGRKITGTVSGNRIEYKTEGGGYWSLASGTVSGGGMSGTWRDSNGVTGTFSRSRKSIPPSVDVAGTWSGTSTTSGGSLIEYKTEGGGYWSRAYGMISGGTMRGHWRDSNNVTGTFERSRQSAPPPAPGRTVNDARFVPAGAARGIGSLPVPARMAAGKEYLLSLAFRNTGTSTWSLDEYSLVFQSTGAWRGMKVPLTGSAPVSPGGAARFTFRVSAPLSTGRTSAQWRLERSGRAFGEPSPRAVVEVVPRASATSPRIGGAAGGRS